MPKMTATPILDKVVVQLDDINFCPFEDENFQIDFEQPENYDGTKCFECIKQSIAFELTAELKSEPLCKIPPVKEGTN